MKSATLPRVEDKKIVRNALPTSNIFTAAVARLYLVFNDETNWRYSGLWGAMAFCRDRNKNDSCFLRLIDMENNRGVIWEQELYIGFGYTKECSFLHSFQTDDCLAGILFVHQGEADDFYNKVLNRDSITLKNDRTKQKCSVGRVKFTPGRGFSVDNDDPEVLEILRELEKLENFSAADIDQNQDFIQDFIRKYRHSKKKSTNRRGQPRLPPLSQNISEKTPSPPPIPPLVNRPYLITHRSSPPPPVPCRGIRQSSSIPSEAPTSMGKAPPAPSATLSPATSLRISNGAEAPPPPPPPFPSMLTATGSLCPKLVVSDNRSNLMAAIRSTGGFRSLTRDGSLKPAIIKLSESAAAAGNFSQNSSHIKNNMTSSLAAALQQRKIALMQSDDSDFSDDDWK
ncbi:hypothetical protein BD408DRAFT_421139 [Parasitella parasitica]|nr:hypothetical protein BD408DRAFT_421139 [Parasitella parasitica]